jgi:hypothetical protein
MIRQILSIIAIATVMFSIVPSPAVNAQGGDGIKREVNAGSGKVSFIGPESGRVLSASRALGTFVRPQDPAMALAKRFAPEFGLKNPERDLFEIKANRSEDGRVIVRYQQHYQGIPVMGGELIVNTNENGDLYSMNGEVSPDLSLPTQPEIAPGQARDTALQALAKWYQGVPADFVASEPELWIYDESLLQPSTRPVELVWRMEVTSADTSQPVRELVLVNAQRGNISLHFNQIDTAWTGSDHSNNIQAPTAPVFSSKNPEKSESAGTTHLTVENILTIAPATWYVTTTGNDSNSCTATGSPCLTINGAIGKAASGDMIKVATGTYTNSGTEVVLINKSITLSGGWNASFTTQSGMSTIDGQQARRGLMVNSGVTAIIERFVVQNGNSMGGGGGICNSGTLTLNNTSIKDNTATTNASSNGCNASSNGGGIYNTNTGILALNDSTVTGSSVDCSGSGVYNEGVLPRTIAPSNKT